MKLNLKLQVAMKQIKQIASGFLLLGLFTSAAQAQTYPTRPIKIIVPVIAGSPVDAGARVIAQHLQVKLGQSVVVENRPGAGTTLGVRAVANAPADGYTVLLMSPNIAYYPVLFPALDFDPVKRLTPVAIAATWSHIIAVGPDVPARTISELVEYAKANPEKLIFGYGLGSPPHILGAVFKRASGIELTSIPYRGGEQARTDLLGGRVHINIAPVPNLLSLIQEGRVRALAFTGPQRSPDLPDVPTMIESGYPEVGFNPDAWLGLFAPASTPADIVAKLNREFNEVVQSPEAKATLTKLGFDPKAATPEEFRDFFHAELKKWPPLLHAAGIKPEQ
jgi:tripartite-type tricarboxylate transporter receptor subunit TctC